MVPVDVMRIGIRSMTTTEKAIMGKSEFMLNPIETKLICMRT